MKEQIKTQYFRKFLAECDRNICDKIIKICNSKNINDDDEFIRMIANDFGADSEEVNHFYSFLRENHL